MKTIKPLKKLDCLTALEVFRQVPIKTTGINWSKHGILRGMFYLQANPKDERFDSRYNLTLGPYRSYIFNVKDSSEDLGLLLVSGKRPRSLNLSFNNHFDERKTWLYLVKDYIPGLIGAGYDYIPSQNHTIAKIFADRDTNKYDRKQRLINDEKEILVVSPSKIRVRQGDLFGVPLVSDKVYKTICDLVR